MTESAAQPSTAYRSLGPKDTLGRAEDVEAALVESGEVDDDDDAELRAEDVLTRELDLSFLEDIDWTKELSDGNPAADCVLTKVLEAELDRDFRPDVELEEASGPKLSAGVDVSGVLRMIDVLELSDERT